MCGEWTRITNKRFLGCYLSLTGDIYAAVQWVDGKAQTNGRVAQRRQLDGEKRHASLGSESNPTLKVATRVKHSGTRGETAKYSDNYIMESLTGTIVTRWTKAPHLHLYFRAVQNF